MTRSSPDTSTVSLVELTEWFNNLDFDRSNPATRHAEYAELLRIVGPAQAPATADEVSLRNPVFVHMNMLRGGIAKPTWEQIKHLYPEEFAQQPGTDDWTGLRADGDPITSRRDLPQAPPATDDDWNIRKYIDFLRADEGDSVTILCDNPDFNLGANNAVECNGHWTDWKDKRFDGETLLAALELAYFECRQRRETLAVTRHRTHQPGPLPHAVAAARRSDDAVGSPVVPPAECRYPNCDLINCDCGK